MSLDRWQTIPALVDAPRASAPEGGEGLVVGIVDSNAGQLLAPGLPCIPPKHPVEQVFSTDRSSVAAERFARGEAPSHRTRSPCAQRSAIPANFGEFARSTSCPENTPAGSSRSSSRPLSHCASQRRGEHHAHHCKRVIFRCRRPRYGFDLACRFTVNFCLALHRSPERGTLCHRAVTLPLVATAVRCQSPAAVGANPSSAGSSLRP